MKTVHAVLFAFAMGALSSAGQTLIVPNANTFVSGNSSDQIPAAPESIEFQELLGAGQFHSSPITITGISLRAAPGTGPFAENIGNLTVTLSNSPNYPNTNGGPGPLMSSTFANNVGTNKMQVFSGSNVSLKDSGCAAPGPVSNFSGVINIVFQTPFVYSSSTPLLIDIVETNVSGSGALDAASFAAPGGSVATVVGAVGSATGTFSYAGPVVGVTYTTSAPAITGVVNVASSIPPGMPNYGIAQGSLFAVYGSNMGGATLAAAQLPLPTAGVAGTSLTVTVNGTAVNVPLYFTRGDIVVGVMPSTTPIGNGNLTLNYTSGTATTPITVVQTAFGISYNPIAFASNAIGTASSASVTFENYISVTPTNTAKPGDTLTIWGTGLGPTPNNGGDTTTPPAGNIGTAPQVLVGGVASPSVTYWGRSPGIFPGLDQINFVVPQNAPLGCNVSVAVETANPATVSNAPTISLAAADGTTCSDPTEIITAAGLSLPNAKAISPNLHQNIFVSPNANGSTTTSTSNDASVLVVELTNAQIAQIAQENNVEPSFGSCSVGINPNPNANSPFSFTPLNAGASITLTPPAGEAPLRCRCRARGTINRRVVQRRFRAGSWKLTNGTGGADIGALSFNFPVPAQVTWTNQAATLGATITRSSPYTVTWTGGDANGYVDIQGSAQAATPQSGLYYIGFECAAPASAGSFTIPSSILMAMPPGAGALASLQVSTFAMPYSMGNVPGFDFAIDGSLFQVAVPVIFK